MFFQVRRDESENISSHVAKLQNLFVDLNNELKKHNKNKLSECMLTARILSTFKKSYNYFKDLWDTIPEANQTVNLLIEKLCNIELRESKSTEQQNSAFFSHKTKNFKKSSADRKSSQKSIKNTERAKQRFPCNKCKKFGHWAAECPEKKDKDLAEKNKNPRKKDKDLNEKKDAFIAHVFGALVEKLPLDSWCCDSGASVHITHSKQYFYLYVQFPVPERISLGKRNFEMQAIWARYH